VVNLLSAFRVPSGQDAEEAMDMWRRLQQHFLAGLVMLLPFLVSLYVIDMLLVWATNATSFLAKLLFGARVPWAGLWGLLIALAIIAVVGVVANQFAGRALLRWSEQALRRVPVWGGLYDGVKRVLGLVLDRTAHGFQRVVLVPGPGEPGRLVAFLVGEADAAGRVAVFVPMSPPTGGFVMLFPEESVEPANMSVEEAIRMLLSAGTMRPGAPVRREG
jgi:uncharacterized membrane protein